MLQLQIRTTWATPTHHLSGFGQVIIFIMKNGAGNRAAGRNDQKHHANSGPKSRTLLSQATTH
jgi:hypothetical protein